MAGSRCVHGVLEGTNKYSSPVPVIGLYIAAGTLVCMFFMLYDIVSGFRRRQRWLPCLLFTLNSVTLTLVSIATKITVDLTTPMPSVHDQLSKLTGTVLICIFMGFVCPSVAIGGSERFSNMAALSILVITVVVNICIQIGTGVIHIFITEHIIIMCCMLVVLLLLWFFMYENRGSVALSKRYYTDHIAGRGYNAYDPKYTETSMFERLKVCYHFAFTDISQLGGCRHINYSTIAGFCIICFSVLIQAVVRFLVLNKSKLYCGGKSDYDWSMLIIVVIQILTIGLGCFATSFRWFTLFPQVEFKFRREEEYSNSLIRDYSFLGTLWQKFILYLQYYVWYVVLLARMLLLLPAITAFKMFGGHVSLLNYGRWENQKVSASIKRWAGKTDPPKHLSQILSRTLRSQQFDSKELDKLYKGDESDAISHLSLVLLVKTASICFPSEMTESLKHSLAEVFDILDFINARVRPEHVKKRSISKLAEAAFVGDGFDCYFSEDMDDKSQFSLERARFILEKVRDIYWCQPIADLITGDGQFASLDELYKVIEQIYVDILHLYLVHLPKAIFKYIEESPEEECETRARRALKMLIKVQPLEAQVQWLLPEGSGITSLISLDRNPTVQSKTDPPAVMEQTPVPSNSSSDVIQK